MRLVFACGGTGGHINPAIAVAKLVRARKSDAKILFLGVSGGMETRLVRDAGFGIRTIEAEGISRGISPSSLMKNVRALKKAYVAEHDAAKILKEFKPDAVIGTGGYACFPALGAASKLKIPTLLHESNAYPGLVTRVLSGRVSKVLLNFESSRELIDKRASCAVVGTPVREDILMYDRNKAREELGLSEKPLLVSFWGSLGAREMNKHIAEFIKLETEKKAEFYHIHATGKFGYEWMPKYISDLGVDLEKFGNITLREYIDDMPRVLAAADLVMCRGGASTLAEITALGKPSVIVPSPNVTNNHQLKNARELEVCGGAVVIEESAVTPKLLFDTASELLSDEEKRREMSRALGKISVLDAGEAIYNEIIKIAR